MHAEVTARRPGCLLLALALLCGHAQADDDHFDILRYEISGNSLLTAQVAEAAVQAHAGAQRRPVDIERARDALERAYRRAGYGAVLVSIPEQELTGGVVQLQVIEARLDNISTVYRPLEGMLHFSERNIRNSLPALQEHTPPNTVAISEAIQLANENPAKQVETLIRAGKAPGQLDAEISVQASTPQKFFLTLDDTGSSSTGRYRLGVGYQHANLFDRDHVATLNYTTSPENPSQVNLYSLSYRLPLYALGDTLDFIYAHSDVDSGSTATVAGPLTFSGKGEVLGLRYNYLLPRRGEYTHRLIFGLEHRAFDNACALGVFGPLGCGPAATDVTLHPASLSYAGQWQHPGLVTSFSVSYSRNWPGGEHGSEDDFNAARPANTGTGGAPADYQLLRLGATLVKILPRDWQLRIAGSAQLTDDALISAEQLGLTGATTVRGFDEREAARDRGYVLSVEGYSPDYAGRLGWKDGSARALLFVDHAAGRNRLLPGEPQQELQLSSWGVGVRGSFSRHLNFRLDAARIMQGDGVREDGDSRVHFSLHYEY